MGRRKGIPGYTLHKSSGQAVVRLDGRDYYLGQYGSPESRARYAELIARHTANPGLVDPATADATVSELVASYLKFAETYYTDSRRSSGQLDRVKRSLAVVLELFSSTPARQFGPQALAAVRTAMVKRDWCRTHVNSCIGCIKRAWKWAVSMELVPGSVYGALTALPDLQRGRTSARESAPVGPAPQASIDAVLQVLQPTLADMVRVQLLTSMRPGEVCAMHSSHLTYFAPDVWLYRPVTHKMAYRGRDRTIAIGPQAVAILSRYLVSTCPGCGLTDRRYRLAWRSGTCGPCADRQEDGILTMQPTTPSPDVPCAIFSPREVRRDWHTELRRLRKSRVQPSQQRSRAKKHPQKPCGEFYTSNTYAQAIRRACKGAGVEPFHPHQLRHTSATRIKEALGWDEARQALGHASVDTTQIYVEDELRSLIEIARKTG